MDISIVIVTNNHQNLIGPCLRSCTSAIARVSGEIIVIDNCSVDGTIAEITPLQKNIIFLQNKRAQGFAANLNQGIKIAAGRYIIALNPDTSFDSNTLKCLVDLADQIEKLGLLAPSLLYPDGTLQPSCRRFPSLGSVLHRRTPLRWLNLRSHAREQHLMSDFKPSDRTLYEVDWVLGAFMLIPRSVIEQVGYFDERFRLYVEDIDFCLRLHRHEFKVVYAPECRVVHHHQAYSDRKLFSAYSYYHVRSILSFIWKYRLDYKHYLRSSASSLPRPLSIRTTE